MIGKILDRRYQILEFLGEGSFAKTYLAIDTRRPGNPQCVIKHLRPTRNSAKSLQAARRRFQREVQILEKLGRKHDQIPTLLAYFEAKQDFFIVEDFIPGPCLVRELVAGKPWAEKATLNLLRELLEILVFVHSHGVIHRDVTPKNIIRRLPDRKLVLIDFGAVKEIAKDGLEMQIPRTIATGTPAYMPLEQFQGNPQLNSDVYAVGMIGIQSLTGVTAKELPKLKNPSEKNPELSLWQEQVKISHQFAIFLQKMVDDDCYLRYHSAAEALTDLYKMCDDAEGFQLPTTIIDMPQTPPQPIQFSATREWFSFGPVDTLLRWVCLGGIGAIILGGLGLLFHNQTQMKAEEYYRRGIERAKRGEVEKAQEDYSRAISLEPDDAGAYNSRGAVRFQLGDYQGAAEDYSQVIRLNSDDAEAYNNRCLAQLHLSKLEDALSDCSRAISLLPTHANAYKNRCLVYLHLGAYQRGIEDCTRAISLNPKDAESHNNRGLVRSAMGENKTAIEDFTQALQLGLKEETSPASVLSLNNAVTHTNRCIAYLNLGNFTAAIDECSQAITINQNHGPAYQQRCLAEYQKAAYQKALNDCNRAISLNKNDSIAYINRGLVRTATGDKRGAITDFTRAINLNRNDADAWTNRARIYVELSDYQKAIADYSQALQLMPTAGDLYYERGRVFALINEHTSAIEDLQKAAKSCIDKGNTQCYNKSLNLIKKLQI
ncbi:tetratricopeptide repeat protein [Ancylothrix sp. C2]|uniref:tetratricopeptide repeat protein n=1 Tax=Ancylothrix sp. D3o TaxID=2953691 RepID=UPI0021BAEB18|nr:serine/threonine-protein kinase [Ancylothrix sp. D3o]MCT7950338.1 tetratricopeptide repeat protein [Ancylothrix sp. D3o]